MSVSEKPAPYSDCRLCGRSALCTVNCMQNTQLLHNIQQLLQLKIDAGDVYPKAVCTSCEKLLQEFVLFQALVKETQQMWHKKHAAEQQIVTCLNESDSDIPQLLVSDSSNSSNNDASNNNTNSRSSNISSRRSTSTSTDLCETNTQPVCWTCALSLDSHAERSFHQTTHAARQCPVCGQAASNAASVREHWTGCGLPAQKVPADKPDAKDAAKVCNDPKLAMRCMVRVATCRELAALVSRKSDGPDVSATKTTEPEPESETDEVPLARRTRQQTEALMYTQKRITRSIDAPLAAPLHYVDMSDEPDAKRMRSGRKSVALFGVQEASAAHDVRPQRIRVRRNTRQYTGSDWSSSMTENYSTDDQKDPPKNAPAKITPARAVTTPAPVAITPAPAKITPTPACFAMPVQLLKPTSTSSDTIVMGPTRSDSDSARIYEPLNEKDTTLDEQTSVRLQTLSVRMFQMRRSMMGLPKAEFIAPAVPNASLRTVRAPVTQRPESVPVVQRTIVPAAAAADDAEESLLVVDEKATRMHNRKAEQRLRRQRLKSMAVARPAPLSSRRQTIAVGTQQMRRIDTSSSSSGTDASQPSSSDTARSRIDQRRSASSTPMDATASVPTFVNVAKVAPQQLQGPTQPPTPTQLPTLSQVPTCSVQPLPIMTLPIAMRIGNQRRITLPANALDVIRRARKDPMHKELLINSAVNGSVANKLGATPSAILPGSLKILSPSELNNRAVAATTSITSAPPPATATLASAQPSAISAPASATPLAAVASFTAGGLVQPQPAPRVHRVMSTVVAGADAARASMPCVFIPTESLLSNRQVSIQLAAQPLASTVQSSATTIPRPTITLTSIPRSTTVKPVQGVFLNPNNADTRAQRPLTFNGTTAPNNIVPKTSPASKPRSGVRPPTPMVAKAGGTSTIETNPRITVQLQPKPGPAAAPSTTQRVSIQMQPNPGTEHRNTSAQMLPPPIRPPNVIRLQNKNPQTNPKMPAVTAAVGGGQIASVRPLTPNVSNVPRQIAQASTTAAAASTATAAAAAASTSTTSKAEQDKLFRIRLSESTQYKGQVSVMFRDGSGRVIDFDKASDDLIARLRECLCMNTQFNQILKAMKEKPMDVNAMRIMARILPPDRMAQLRGVHEGHAGGD